MPGHQMPPDQNNPITPTNPQPDAPENPTTTGSADAPQPPKTYTEAEVNAMVTARLAKQEKALKAQLAEEAQTAAERAKLDEVERVKAEKADIEKRAAEAEARAIAAERRASLTGKVADPVAALKLLDPEAHLTEDGSVNVEALLEAYPFLAPTKPGPAGVSATAPTQANTKTAPATLADAINQHYNT